MSTSYIFKILLTGDGAVGKTSIRERYMGKGFSGDYLKTIGADFASKSLEIEGIPIKMQIFDLAGQDAYVAARKSFYRGGHAAFLVFDVQDPETLTNLKNWIEDCTESSDNSIQTFIALGNKADLVETRQVTPEMAVDYLRQMAAKYGITFYYMDTSAKTGLNIDIAFDIMARQLLIKREHKVPIFEHEGVYEISSGGSGSVEKEVAAAVETVAQASNALIGGVLQEGEKMLERMDKMEKAMVKVMKKVSVLEKKMDRVVTVLRGLMEGKSDFDIKEETEEVEEITEEKEEKKDFGVPGIPKR